MAVMAITVMSTSQIRPNHLAEVSVLRILRRDNLDVTLILSLMSSS